MQNKQPVEETQFTNNTFDNQRNIILHQIHRAGTIFNKYLIHLTVWGEKIHLLPAAWRKTPIYTLPYQNSNTHCLTNTFFYFHKLNESKAKKKKKLTQKLQNKTKKNIKFER